MRKSSPVLPEAQERAKVLDIGGKERKNHDLPGIP